MLHAAPTGLFTWDYTVYEDDTPIAFIDMSWWRERGEVQIAGVTFQVYRESLLAGRFVLQSGDQVLARAEKPSAFFRAFTVEADGRRMELRALSWWTRSFGLFEGGRQVGSIRPKGWLTRKAVINLPSDLFLPVRVFLFWLVLILWRRAAQSSHGAAGAGS
jgi:hypothetical protein